MLETKITLVPHGVRENAREIATAIIGNISPGTPPNSDYLVRLADDRKIGCEFIANDVRRDEDVWRFLYEILSRRKVDSINLGYTRSFLASEFNSQMGSALINPNMNKSHNHMDALIDDESESKT